MGNLHGLEISAKTRGIFRGVACGKPRGIERSFGCGIFEARRGESNGFVVVGENIRMFMLELVACAESSTVARTKPYNLILRMQTW